VTNIGCVTPKIPNDNRQQIIEIINVNNGDFIFYYDPVKLNGVNDQDWNIKYYGSKSPA
jgi:hypothetical protein